MHLLVMTTLRQKKSLLTANKEEDLQHKRSLGLTAASGVDTEVDLILARSSIFSCPPNISDLNICPAHRYSLGIGWRRGAARCRVPTQLSKHVRKSRAADRGIGKELSRSILKLQAWIFQIHKEARPHVIGRQQPLSRT